jgi:hypothetical protein
LAHLGTFVVPLARSLLSTYTGGVPLGSGLGQTFIINYHLFREAMNKVRNNERTVKHGFIQEWKDFYLIIISHFLSSAFFYMFPSSCQNLQDTQCRHLFVL